MQRIPIMDPFGTPRRMGIVEPVNGQQQPPTATIPAPASTPTTAFRFEIVDAEGNPVPGAAVSIYLNDAHMITLPLSDVGGNASVSVRDLQEADSRLRQQRGAGPVAVPSAMGQISMPATPKKLVAVIQAPGYQEQKIELADMNLQRSWADVEQRRVVTLQKADEGSPLLPILGIVAGIGLVVWLANRS